MNNDSIDPVKQPAPENSGHFISIGLPLIGILILFVLGVRGGGEVADRGILPLVRFLSLLILAMGVFSAVVVGLNYFTMKTRWIIGQTAAGFLGLSAGFIWSAAAYFSGFGALIIGVTVISLLMFNELGDRSKRQRFARQGRFNPLK